MNAVHIHALHLHKHLSDFDTNDISNHVQCHFIMSNSLYQELLALLDHLDKEGKGHVGMEEFVHGLQSMRTSASVATSTPPSTILGPESNDRPHRHNEDVR